MPLKRKIEELNNKSDPASGEKIYNVSMRKNRCGERDKQFSAFSAAFGYAKKYLLGFNIAINEDYFGPTDISFYCMSPKMCVDRLLTFQPSGTPSHLSIVLGHIHQSSQRKA